MWSVDPYQRSVQRQNAGDTQFDNRISTVPGYSPLRGVPWERMYTPEDQIHWLLANCLQTGELENTIEESQKAQDARWLADQNRQTRELQAYADRGDVGVETRLNKRIDDISASERVWDVTRGLYDASDIANTRLFNSLATNSLCLADLEHARVGDPTGSYDDAREFTVEDMTEWGLNAYGFAVYNFCCTYYPSIPSQAEGKEKEYMVLPRDGNYYYLPCDGWYTETPPQDTRLTALQLGAARIDDEGYVVTTADGTPMTSAQLGRAEVADDGRIKEEGR